MSDSFSVAIGAKLLVFASAVAVLVSLTRPQQDRVLSPRGYVCVFASERHRHDGSTYMCDFALSTASLTLVYQFVSLYVLFCLKGVNLPGWRVICSLSSQRAAESLLVMLTFLFDGIFCVMNMASFCLQLSGHMTEGDRASDKTAVRVAIVSSAILALLTMYGMFHLAHFAQAKGKIRYHRYDPEKDAADRRTLVTAAVMCAALISSAVALVSVGSLENFKTPTMLPSEPTAVDKSSQQTNGSNDTNETFVDVKCVFGRTASVCQFVEALSVISLTASSILFTLHFLLARVRVQRLLSWFIATRVVLSILFAAIWATALVVTSVSWTKRIDPLVLSRERHRNAMAVISCSAVSMLTWAIGSCLVVHDEWNTWNGLLATEHQRCGSSANDAQPLLGLSGGTLGLVTRNERHAAKKYGAMDTGEQPSESNMFLLNTLSSNVA